MKKLFILILVLLIFPNLYGSTFYVATDGNDSNPGTISQPFLTWQKGINSAYAGDTIFIRGGVYYITGYDNFPEVNPAAYPTAKGRTGTAANKIYMWAYPADYIAGNYPILDCKDAYTAYSTNFSGLKLNLVEYWHLKGLTIRNVYQREGGGKLAQGFGMTSTANLTFENCTAHDISGRGFYYESGAWNEWESPGAPFASDSTSWVNCDAYNLCDSTSTNPGNAADGWKGNIYYNGTLYWRDCRAWNYSDDGFDPHGGGKRIFDGCWAMSTSKYSAFDIEGNGFKTASINEGDYEYIGPGYVSIETYNCIAAFNHTYGFYNNLESNYDNNGKYVNNTAYKNGRTGFFDMPLGITSRGSEYKNNVSYANLGENYEQVGIYNPSVYIESNNTWMATQELGPSSWPGWEYNTDVSVTDADFVSLDSSQIRLPRKSDGSLPDITFLKLVSSSDLVDAGTYAELPYYGTAPDIGYSEYAPIIADHTIVDKYSDIPQVWIDSIKTMLVNIAGMSHSVGYQNGINLLELLNPVFQCTTYIEGYPSVSTEYLRLGRNSFTGSESWSVEANKEFRAESMYNQYVAGNPFGVWALGWCWDMAWHNDPGGTIDPVYNVRWAGDDGTGLRYGLDSGDEVLTGNSNSMDTYLAAVEYWKNYCDSTGTPTQVIFTTGPVDTYTGENGFQRELKHQHIRNYVLANNGSILFDYADILVHNNSGEKNQENWNDGGSLRAYDQIHPDNMMDYDSSWNIIAWNDTDGDHIGEVGALRLGKAMWWLLARIAGWDGLSIDIPQSDSTYTDILTFTLADQTGAATINTTNHTVAIEVDYTADITDLTPTITLSYGATIIPASGVARDFTSPVPYTVTALDGVTYQEWTVTVTQEEEPEEPPVASTGSIVKFNGKIVKR